MAVRIVVLDFIPVLLKFNVRASVRIIGFTMKFKREGFPSQRNECFFLLAE
jgi:hypothetical protein